MQVHDPAFDGEILYEWQPKAPADVKANGNPMDMKFAQYTQPAKGDVYPWAYGFRNPFGCHLTIEDELFCTDNGPNQGFGGLIEGFRVVRGVEEPKLLGGDPNGKGVWSLTLC